MSLGFGSDLDIKPVTSDGDTGDNQNLAHYSDKVGLVEAMIYGTTVTAICGHTYVPMRDPNKYPICPRCKAIYDGLPDGDDS